MASSVWRCHPGWLWTPVVADDDMREVQQDVAPDAVLDEIEAQERESSAT